MLRIRIAGVVGAVMLAALTSGCSVESAPVEASSRNVEYGFSVLRVEAGEAEAEGATATIYIPAFWSGVAVRVLSVERYALGSEVCAVSVVSDEAETTGACDVLALQRLDNGTLDGLRVLLTGLAPGDHEFDVLMFPVPQNTKTGEFRYDYEPPSVARLRVSVPAA